MRSSFRQILKWFSSQKFLLGLLFLLLLLVATLISTYQANQKQRLTEKAQAKQKRAEEISLTYPEDKWQRIWYDQSQGAGGDYLQGQKPDAYIELPMGAAGELQFDEHDNLIVQDHTWPRVWVLNLDKDPSWLKPASTTADPTQIWFYNNPPNVLKLFGQKNFQETSEDTVVANKIYHASGVLVDKSTTPNRIYVVDTGNNRVLGFSSLGYCQSNSNIKCTNDLDCPGSTCYIDGKKSTDLIFGQPDSSSAACNHDNNLGIYKNPSADSLCFIHYPEAGNIQEYWMRTNIDVDNKGNLYAPDVQNNRILVYNNPFSTDKSGGKGDTIPDFVIGQDDFNFGKVNRGMGKETRNDSSIFIGRSGNNVSTRGVSVDTAGNVWVADTFNRRILRFSAGSKNADLVLGQPNFSYSTYSPCHTLPSERPRNQVCHPTLAKVHPQTGDLYVIDEGGDGAFAARILVFRPPFSNGMSASRVIVPKGVTFTNWSGVNGGSKYVFQTTGFIFNTFKEGEYANGVLWINELSANRVLLIDEEGNVIKIIGAKALDLRGGDQQYGGQCGSIYDNFNLWAPGGSIGVDSANNLYFADERFHRISRYALPYQLQNVGGETCLPDSNAGLFAGTRQNSVSGYKFGGGVVGVFTFENQLIVSDHERFLVWNNYLNKQDGDPADLVIGQPSAYTKEHNLYQLSGRTFYTTDDQKRLWFTNAQGRLIVFNVPFNENSQPLANHVRLYWADDRSEVNYSTKSVVFDKYHKKIWISDGKNNRLLRVSDYQHPENGLTVDAVIGQPNKESTCCNQEPKVLIEDKYVCPPIPEGYLTHGPAKTNGLCENYQIEFDNFGNLYVVENNYENHGNSRIIMFEARDLQGATGLFPNISAKKVFIQSSLTEHARARCAGMINEPCSPVSIAFNSKNQMVVGNDGYYSNNEERHLKQLWFYDDPLKKTGSNLLGEGPDETDIQFSNNWREAELAYGKRDNIHFKSHCQ